MDRIVYEVTSIDDLNQSKPTTFAAFSREIAEQKMAERDQTHKTLKLIALSDDEMEKIRKEALAKLTGVERLLLNIQEPVPKNEREKRAKLTANALIENERRLEMHDSQTLADERSARIHGGLRD